MTQFTIKSPPDINSKNHLKLNYGIFRVASLNSYNAAKIANHLSVDAKDVGKILKSEEYLYLIPPLQQIYDVLILKKSKDEYNQLLKDEYDGEITCKYIDFGGFPKIKLFELTSKGINENYHIVMDFIFSKNKFKQTAGLFLLDEFTNPHKTGKKVDEIRKFYLLNLHLYIERVYFLMNESEKARKEKEATRKQSSYSKFMDNFLKNNPGKESVSNSELCEAYPHFRIEYAEQSFFVHSIDIQLNVRAERAMEVLLFYIRDETRTKINDKFDDFIWEIIHGSYLNSRDLLSNIVKIIEQKNTCDDEYLSNLFKKAKLPKGTTITF